MLDAIIFDFDGTIADTETCGYRAGREIYAERGVDLPMSAWASVVGVAYGSHTFFDGLPALGSEDTDLEAAYADYRRRKERLLSSLAPCPGVVDLVHEARARNIKLAVASSSNGEWVRRHLKHLQMDAYFSAICTSDDVDGHVKPEPDIYLQALERLGVRADQALAIEDSPTGAAAAHNAGLWCLVVPNPITVQLPFGHVDARLDSLEGVGVEDLVRLWTQRAG